MSLQLGIVGYLESQELDQQIAEKRAEIAELHAGVDAVDEASEKSFVSLMGVMRTSYLMFSGMGRILGGGMTMAFRSMYNIGMSAVGTYSAIAAAMAATGTPWDVVKSLIMITSLGLAQGQLVSVLAGQNQLTQQVRGLNMMLHGLSGLIRSSSYTY